MSQPSFGSFATRQALLDAVEADFLRVSRNGRPMIYGGKRKAAFVHAVFDQLRTRINEPSKRLVLREAALIEIGDGVGLVDRELRAAVQTLAEAFAAWEMKNFPATINGELQQVVVSGDFCSAAGRLLVDLEVGLDLLDGEPDTGDADVNRDHLLRYLRWLTNSLRRSESQIGRGIYIPVAEVRPSPSSPRSEIAEMGDDQPTGRNQPSRWNEVRTFGSVAVVAPAGRGKTSLLRAEAKRFAELALPALEGDTPVRLITIPLFLRLDDVSEVMSSGQPLEEMLQLTLKRAEVDSGVIDAVVAHVIRGAALLLLDGLDEVPWERRDDIDDMLILLAERRIPTTFSSRRESFDFAQPLLRELYTAIELMPFSPASVDSYLHARFHDPVMLAMASSRVASERQPWDALLLALFCDALDDGEAPRSVRRLTRIELYDRLLRTTLQGPWRQQKHPERRRRFRVADAKIRALEELAMLAAFTPDGRISECDLAHVLVSHPFDVGTHFDHALDELVEGDGILVRRGGVRAEYEFLHPTFRSYLTARRLASTGAPGVTMAMDRAWFDSHWQDVVVFMASLGALDPSTILSTVERSDVFNQRLYLAGRCLGHVKGVDQRVTAIADRILSIYQHSRFDERADARPALVEMGQNSYEAVLREFTECPNGDLGHLLADVATDHRAARALRAFVKDVRADLAERAMAAAAATRLGEHDLWQFLFPIVTWEGNFIDVAARYGVPAMVSKAIAQGAFSDDAAQRIYAEYSRYPSGSFERHALAGALPQIHTPTADALAWQILADKSEIEDIREDLATAMFVSRSGRTALSLLLGRVFPLITTMACEGVRRTEDAVAAMKRSSDNVAAAFAAALDEELDAGDARFRRGLLASEDPAMQLAAIELFRESENRLCVQALAILAIHEDASIRSRAVRSCRNFPSAAVDSIVLDLLDDPDIGVRIDAISTTAELRLKSSVAKLESLATAADDAIAWSATDALASIAEVETAPTVVRRFHEAQATASQLAHFHDDRVWPLLENRWKAVAPSATYSVDALLLDEDVERSRRQAKDAASALGILRDPRAVDLLLNGFCFAAAIVRPSIIESLDLLMNHSNAVVISTRVLDGIDVISARDNRHVVQIPSCGPRTIDFGFGRLFDETRAMYRLLRRAAPIVRRELSDEDWERWCERCLRVTTSSVS